MNWIKCSDRLPERLIRVIIANSNEWSIGCLSQYDSGKLMWDHQDEYAGYSDFEFYTHWMIPELPDET